MKVSAPKHSVHVNSVANVHAPKQKVKGKAEAIEVFKELFTSSRMRNSPVSSETRNYLLEKMQQFGNVEGSLCFEKADIFKGILKFLQIKYGKLDGPKSVQVTKELIVMLDAFMEISRSYKNANAQENIYEDRRTDTGQHPCAGQGV